MTTFFKNHIPENIKNKSGIYKILNLVNGKVYIGKTINFRKRYVAYKGAYKKQDKRKINEYFLNSIKKHKPENFIFSALEVCPIDLLADRELYWMLFYSSTETDKGYNLRMDSSTGMVVHQSTREKISTRIKKEYAEGIRTSESISKFATELWKDSNLKDQMRKQVSESRRSFFVQSDKANNVIAVWDGINQILNFHKDYKFQNIYAACNGNKNNYRGFIWKRYETLEEWMIPYLIDGNSELCQNPSEKSVYEKGVINRGGLWLYTICDGDTSVEMIGRDLVKLFPSVYSAFHRLKKNEIKHKGVLIKRRRFEENNP